MREIIEIETHRREVMVDITPQVESVVQQSGIQNGLVSMYRIRGQYIYLELTQAFEPERIMYTVPGIEVVTIGRVGFRTPIAGQRDSTV